MNATLLDRLAGVVPEAALRVNACSLIVARMLSSGWFVEKPGSAGSVYAPWQLGLWGNILAAKIKSIRNLNPTWAGTASANHFKSSQVSAIA